MVKQSPGLFHCSPVAIIGVVSGRGKGIIYITDRNGDDSELETDKHAKA